MPFIFPLLGPTGLDLINRVVDIEMQTQKSNKKCPNIWYNYVGSKTKEQFGAIFGGTVCLKSEIEILKEVTSKGRLIVAIHQTGLLGTFIIVATGVVIECTLL